MDSPCLYDLIEDVVDLTRDFRSRMERVSADKIGLDPRAGMVYVGEDCIAVDSNYVRALEYYGGFEYVEKCFRITVGDMTFYTDEDSRVSRCLERYSESADGYEPPEAVTGPGLIA